MNPNLDTSQLSATDAWVCAAADALFLFLALSVLGLAVASFVRWWSER